MKKQIFILLISICSFAKAQELSVQIGETFFSYTEDADQYFVYKVHGVEADVAIWDSVRTTAHLMEWNHIETHDVYGFHTWKESGIYMILCTKDAEAIGGRTFFIVNEDYVNYVMQNTPGVYLGDSYVRSEILYIAFGYDKTYLVR